MMMMMMMMIQTTFRTQQGSKPSLTDLLVIVEGQVNNVERKPTSDKDGRHCHQHAVCALLLYHLLACSLPRPQMCLHRNRYLSNTLCFKKIGSLNFDEVIPTCLGPKTCWYNFIKIGPL